jgi:hypothetical protein
MTAMTRPLRSLAAGLLALGLAACAAPFPGALVYNTDFDPAFSGPGQIVLGGVQPVETHGTPPAGLTPDGFAALMRVPGWYPPTRFGIEPGGPDRRGLRFVAAFGTDATTALCERPSPGGDPALVAMALCLQDRLISRAALRMAAGDPGPQIAALMRGLLPPQRPDDTRPCLRRTGC